MTASYTNIRKHTYEGSLLNFPGNSVPVSFFFPNTFFIQKRKEKNAGKPKPAKKEKRKKEKKKNQICSGFSSVNGDSVALVVTEGLNVPIEHFAILVDQSFFFLFGLSWHTSQENP